jgi:hypothetical protein
MSPSRHFIRLVATSAVGLAACLGSAQAAPVLLDVAPFQGSTADPTDGIRTIFGGNERFLPSFNVSADTFVFNSFAFNLPVGPLSFANSTAAALPPSGYQVVVLRDTDNDANPATPFNAGAAANLIANAITSDGAGFFIYSNSALGVNRLVYSTNLNSNTADLSILARIQSPTGAGAVAALPGFTGDNFTVAAVPEPGTLGLLSAGLVALAWRRRAVR